MRQQGPRKRWHPTTPLHEVRTQNTILEAVYQRYPPASPITLYFQYTAVATGWMVVVNVTMLYQLLSYKASYDTLQL